MKLEFSVPQAAGKSKGKRPSRNSAPPFDGASQPLRVVVNPFAISLGAASPATASGYFDLEHYQITLRR